MPRKDGADYHAACRQRLLMMSPSSCLRRTLSSPLQLLTGNNAFLKLQETVCQLVRAQVAEAKHEHFGTRTCANVISRDRTWDSRKFLQSSDLGCISWFLKGLRNTPSPASIPADPTISNPYTKRRQDSIGGQMPSQVGQGQHDTPPPDSSCLSDAGQSANKPGHAPDAENAEHLQNGFSP